MRQSATIYSSTGLSVTLRWPRAAWPSKGDGPGPFILRGSLSLAPQDDGENVQTEIRRALAVRAEVFDQPQQHARAGIGVGDLDMLVGMVADAAAAAHEHHRDIGDIDHRHAVMTGPAWQFEHRIA